MTTRKRITRVSVTHMGSSWPRARMAVRRRNSLHTNQAAAMMPSSSVELFRPRFGPHSGRYPAPKKANSRGAGTEIDFDTQMVRPRKTIMPASVVMKPGMPILASQKPCQAPIRVPTSMPTSRPTHHGRPI